jgi:hypothetical protein
MFLMLIFIAVASGITFFYSLQKTLLMAEE